MSPARRQRGEGSVFKRHDHPTCPPLIDGPPDTEVHDQTEEAMSDVLHRLTCPVRAHWRRRRYSQPLWRDDKTAQMLGIAHKGCARCGRGATALPKATR